MKDLDLGGGDSMRECRGQHQQENREGSSKVGEREFVVEPSSQVNHIPLGVSGVGLSKEFLEIA